MESEEMYKTPFRLKKEARELAIYSEYNELMKHPGAQSTAVSVYLAEKYGYASITTIRFIHERVEKRLKNEKNNS